MRGSAGSGHAPLSYASKNCTHATQKGHPMRKPDFLVRLSVMSLLLGVSLELQAQTCNVTWTGNEGNGSWSTAGNWSPRKVPGTTSDVCIPTFTSANGAGLDGSS